MVWLSTYVLWFVSSICAVFSFKTDATYSWPCAKERLATESAQHVRAYYHEVHCVVSHA